MNKTITTEEGNKLIAVFDGWVKREEFEFLYKKKGRDAAVDQFKYHTSWDWLMDVVEKIESLTAEDGRGEVNYIVSIEDKQCIISQGGEGELVYVQSDEFKIEAVWKSVVQFIQWYNQNKNS